ncbi:hypothetical protein BJX66DRAFT_335401 [Aspergillus keveii]|uniref:Uncharacterized protein n=1 Tax=Aspergillus keveii TaxID=714993 RepID=A0ABR4GD27_9EURO
MEKGTGKHRCALYLSGPVGNRTLQVTQVYHDVRKLYATLYDICPTLHAPGPGFSVLHPNTPASKATLFQPLTVPDALSSSTVRKRYLHENHKSGSSCIGTMDPYDRLSLKVLGSATTTSISSGFNCTYIGFPVTQQVNPR